MLHGKPEGAKVPCMNKSHNWSRRNYPVNRFSLRFVFSKRNRLASGACIPPYRLR